MAAEEVYTHLLRTGRLPQPGGVVDSVFLADGRPYTVRVVVLKNAVWRAGRVFLVCPRCEGRCTRPYLPPIDAAPLWCRRCWGLGYDSQQANYRRGPTPTGLKLGVWLEHCEFALMATANRREARGAAAEKRRRQRRPLLEARANKS